MSGGMRTHKGGQCKTSQQRSVHDVRMYLSASDLKFGMSRADSCTDRYLYFDGRYRKAC